MLRKIPVVRSWWLARGYALACGGLALWSSVALATGFTHFQSPVSVDIPEDVQSFYVVDVNHDGKPDVVLLRWSDDPVSIGDGKSVPYTLPTVTVLLNQGSTAGAGGALTPVFTTQNVSVIDEATLADFRVSLGIDDKAPTWINRVHSASLAAPVDVDGDGYEDLVLAVPGTNELIVLFNQAKSAKAGDPLFVMDRASRKKTLAISVDAPGLVEQGSRGRLMYATVADVTGDGVPDLVGFYGNVQDSVNLGGALESYPGQRDQYEAFSVFRGLGGGGFDLTLQSHAHPGDPLRLGYEPVTDGFCCGFGQNGIGIRSYYGTFTDSHTAFMFSRDESSGGRYFMGNLLYDAPTDVATPSYRSFSLPGVPEVRDPYAAQLSYVGQGQLSVLSPPGQAASIWIEGMSGQAYEMAYDPAATLLKLRNTVTTADSNQRGSSITFGQIGDSNLKTNLLITRGGLTTYYGYGGTTPKKRVDSKLPDPLNAILYPQEQQALGAYVNWLPNLNGGAALVSVKNYHRPGEREYSRDFADEHGVAGRGVASYRQGHRWGEPYLAMVSYAQVDPSDSTRLAPFFGDIAADSATGRFQAISLMSSWRHHPNIQAAPIVTSDKVALIALQDRALQIYQPQAVASLGAVPTLQGFVMPQHPSYRQAGLQAPVNTVVQGEAISIVGDFDPSNPPQYVTVHETGSGTLQRLLPVGALQAAPSGGAYLLPVPGLSTLYTGSRQIAVHFLNGQQTALISLKVVGPYVIERADAGVASACGIAPTASGAMFPGTIRVSASLLPFASVQGARWVNVEKAGVWQDVGLTDAGFAVTSDSVAVPVPTQVGTWQLWVKANDYAQPVTGLWTVKDASQTAAVTACIQGLTQVVNHFAPAQCSDSDFYPESLPLPVAGGKTQTLTAGKLSFAGSGFHYVKAVALEQNGVRHWATANPSYSDDESAGVEVDLGDVKDAFAGTDQAVNLEFYPADQATVEANSVPTVAKVSNWRTLRKGTCPSYPLAEIKINGVPQPDVPVPAEVKNAIYPGWLSGIRLQMTLADGSHYSFPAEDVLTLSRDRWVSQPQSNAKAMYDLTLPHDLTPYKVASGKALTSGEVAFTPRTLQEAVVPLNVTPPGSAPVPPAPPSPWIFPNAAEAGEVTTMAGEVGASISVWGVAWNLVNKVSIWADLLTRSSDVPARLRTPAEDDKPDPEPQQLWLVMYTESLPYDRLPVTTSLPLAIQATPKNKEVIAVKAAAWAEFNANLPVNIGNVRMLRQMPLESWKTAIAPKVAITSITPAATTDPKMLPSIWRHYTVTMTSLSSGATTPSDTLFLDPYSDDKNPLSADEQRFYVVEWAYMRSQPMATQWSIAPPLLYMGQSLHTYKQRDYTWVKIDTPEPPITPVWTPGS